MAVAGCAVEEDDDRDDECADAAAAVDVEEDGFEFDLLYRLLLLRPICFAVVVCCFGSCFLFLMFLVLLF